MAEPAPSELRAEVGGLAGVLHHAPAREDAAIGVLRGHLTGRPAPRDYSDFENWNARETAEDDTFAPTEARAREQRARVAFRTLLADIMRGDETARG